MLRIQCPWCGERDETEFTYGGEATVVRPDEPETTSNRQWVDYLFFRHNVRGRHRERWLHAFGCGQWFEIERDTLTHESGAGAIRPGGDDTW